MDGDYDVVCLDHDLGGDHMVSPTVRNTGSGFLRWLLDEQEYAPKSTQRFFVHSYNTYCALNMVSRLTAAGHDAIYVPFGDALLNALESKSKVN